MSDIGKVDPRVMRTRKLLVDAFESLLAEKTFEDITVQDITARATVNRATFYAHFTDKNALVNDIFYARFAEIVQERTKAPTTCARVYTRQLFLAVTDHWYQINHHCHKTYEMLATLIEVQIKSQLRALLCEWLHEYSATRDLDEQRIDLLATMSSWALYGAAMEWTRQADTYPSERFADAVVPLICAPIDMADTNVHVVA